MKHEQQDDQPTLQREQLLMQDSVTLPEGDSIDTEALKAKAERMFIGVQKVRVEVSESAMKVNGGYKTHLYSAFGRFPR